MTDGVLLAEIAHDRLLRQYDTIILDEAHERSLNIDFLLGYLAQLLPRRPDLKLVITSATIDVERVAAHFAGAPIVEVSGRTYPVEVRYRPVVDPDDEDADPDRDQVTAILDAVDELVAEGPGDILVFLAGEREIRDTQDALAERALPNTEIVPLYSRLSAADQHKVFAPHTGRRIVLATNVAETSLTVPGIRYVIDPGTARISRYSHRTKVQRLPIEPVSQASARQRSGRCGRLGPRHRDPALHRGRLRGPARVHRPRDPAHQPRLGAAADGGPRPRGRRRLPVRRPAGPPRRRRRAGAARGAARPRRAREAHPDRPRAGRAAAGPADGPHGGRGRQSAACSTRCWSSPPA